MKKFIYFLAAGLSLSAQAQQVQIPAPSPPQTIKQDFALSSIELSYSRPGVKGRTVFGDLVPYGKVWRTGANSATTIQFGHDVTVGGQKVPAGKYGLLTIPGADQWIVILSKQLDVNNPALYKQDQDQVRITATPKKLNELVESFTINFTNLTDHTGYLELCWDHTLVSVPIAEDIDSRIMGQIDQAMNKDNRPYFQSAMYYMENGKDLNQALDWFNQAMVQNPDAFFIAYQKARCQGKLGKKKEAIATAQQAIELAKKANNDDYVKLNEKLISSLQ